MTTDEPLEGRLPIWLVSPSAAGRRIGELTGALRLAKVALEELGANEMAEEIGRILAAEEPKVEK